MGGCGLAPGLRTLFGAAKSMGLLPEGETWRKFFGVFEKYSSLSISQAVEVLQYTLGNDRRMLFMVDEISKAGISGDGEVMRQLGHVLDSYGYVDVVVSSLSPLYIHDLFLSYQRKVDYVIPAPLLDIGLGKQECREWADKIIEKVGDVPLVVQNLLRHMYLLLSGHPRSLELMVDTFKARSLDQTIIEALKKKKPLHTVIFDCIEPILRVRVQPPDLVSGAMSKEQLEEFIFSADRSFAATDPTFRYLLEKGLIFIQKEVGDDDGLPVLDFFVAAPGLSLLGWIGNPIVDFAPPSIYLHRTNAAKLLLEGLTNIPSISTWWERFLALTVVSRSCGDSNLSRVFGIPEEEGEESGVFQITPRLAPKGIGYRGLPSPDEHNILTAYSDKQAGFDAHVMVEGRHFYLQAKIQFSQNATAVAAASKGVAGTVTKKEELMDKTTNGIVAGALPFVVLSHLWRYQKADPLAAPTHADLANVHFIIYNWGDHGTTSLSKDAVIKLWKQENDIAKQVQFDNERRSNEDKKMTSLEAYVNSIKGPPPIPANFKTTVDYFLDNHFENIHVVDRTELQNWLLPTFLPFPMMFAEIGEEEKYM